MNMNIPAFPMGKLLSSPSPFIYIYGQRECGKTSLIIDICRHYPQMAVELIKDTDTAADDTNWMETIKKPTQAYPANIIANYCRDVEGGVDDSGEKSFLIMDNCFYSEIKMDDLLCVKRSIVPIVSFTFFHSMRRNDEYEKQNNVVFIFKTNNYHANGFFHKFVDLPDVSFDAFLGLIQRLKEYECLVVYKKQVYKYKVMD